MLERYVGNEVVLDVFTARGAGAFGARPARLVTVAGRLCRGGRTQGRQPVDVVVMGVGDEDMRDRPPARRPQDGRQMRLIIGAGIDQGKRAGADEIGVGALEGEVIGVVGDDAHDTGGELAWLAVGEVHRRLEGQSFAHRGSARGVGARATEPGAIGGYWPRFWAKV